MADPKRTFCEIWKGKALVLKLYLAQTEIYSKWLKTNQG